MKAIAHPLPVEPRAADTAPACLSQLLREFRRSHPLHTIGQATGAWRFVAGGRGKQVLVLLPGLGGTHEIEFEIMASLETRFRVISVGYPDSASTADDLAYGLRALLAASGVQRPVLLGHSLGGMVAQAFALRFESETSGLVLANSGVFCGLRSGIVPAAARLFSRVPEYLLIPLIAHELDQMVKPAAARAFWSDYLRALLAAPGTGRRLRFQTSCLADLNRLLARVARQPKSRPDERLPVLVIESADDGAFSPRERQRIRSFWPSARVHVFPHGTGHLSWLTRPAAFVSAVESFLDSTDGAA